jgi:hypothetical protein
MELRKFEIKADAFGSAIKMENFGSCEIEPVKAGNFIGTGDSGIGRVYKKVIDGPKSRENSNHKRNSCGEDPDLIDSYKQEEIWVSNKKNNPTAISNDNFPTLQEEPFKPEKFWTKFEEPSPIGKLSNPNSPENETDSKNLQNM